MKTLKTFTFLLLMLYTSNSIAQSIIKFTYDEAGNRTKREEIIFPKSSKINSNANLDTVSLVKSFTEILGKMTITIYPNPTRGKLSVEIKNMPTNATGEIRIYNIAGNVIKYQGTLGPFNQFDFTEYPTGMYILNIKVGQEESQWKIIKQ